jgi:5,6,7,8-tetrahydromethanopterin hydro-lyase
MTFMSRHRESERLASQAEEAWRAGEFAEAARLYSLAGDTEEQALADLNTSKVRTVGIAAVSTAALYFKAGRGRDALRITDKWLASGLLPEFATSDLESIRRMVELRHKLESGDEARSLFLLGESLVGDGNEIAHIDLIIGTKSGPAGSAFLSALSNQNDGFSTLLAIVTPNLPAKPDTILFNKVTIKGAKQAGQMFGPAQAAVARAVMDSVASGLIPRSRVDDLCVLAGVFIHWQAEDVARIYEYNYLAMTEAIQRAVEGRPSVEEVLSKYKSARHPYLAGIDLEIGFA